MTPFQTTHLHLEQLDERCMPSASPLSSTPDIVGKWFYGAVILSDASISHTVSPFTSSHGSGGGSGKVAFNVLPAKFTVE